MASVQNLMQPRSITFIDNINIHNVDLNVDITFGLEYFANCGSVWASLIMLFVCEGEMQIRNRQGIRKYTVFRAE